MAAVVAVAAGLVLATAETASATPARAAHLTQPAEPGASTAGSPGRVSAGARVSAGDRVSARDRVSATAFNNPGVLAYGDAATLGGPTNIGDLSAPVVGMAASHDGRGYWLTAADGGVFSYGDVAFHGSAGSININAPIVAMAGTADSGGYWQVALDGGVFTYGDARFYGSTGNIVLNQPVVGMAVTPDGGGYWLVASDGGIFAFGDAQFYGSTGAMTLNSPVVGMAATIDGSGYWLVAADGGIFTFGDAAFYGSAGSTPTTASMSGMAVTHDGKGYWLVGSDGAIYPYGDAVSYGSSAPAPGQPSAPIASVVATPSGMGYWLLEPDAFPVAFSHPGGGSSIVAAAAHAVRAITGGSFCNPYGPCEPWCALFATWTWQTGGGVPIPRYGFVGDVYTWSAGHTAVLAPDARPSPGDAVLYGTGPQNVYTSVHMGIVGQVWPDGAITTIEGDAGPGPDGHYSVIINGPYLPTHSADYNGVPIYAFAVP